VHAALLTQAKLINLIREEVIGEGEMEKNWLSGLVLGFLLT
jgi:hypothetical protein